jgi:ABC-type bacteriocin/lantibiotic exporter with double-glycine peptidase domain
MSGWHQLAVCTLAAVVAALSMAPLELQRRIVDMALEAQALDLLLTLGAAYLAVVLLLTLMKAALRLYQGWLSESAILQNRQLLGEIHDCRVATRSGDSAVSGESEGGRAVSIIGREVEKLGGFVGEGISQPVVSLGMLLAIGGYMIAVEPWIALFSLPFLAAQVAVVPLLQRKINRLLEHRLTVMRRVGATVASMDTQDAQSPDPLRTGDYQRDLRRVFDNRMAIYAIKAAMKAIINLLNHLAPLAVLLVGGIMVVHDQTSVGTVVAFVSGFERLSNPMRDLVRQYRVAAQARVQHALIASWM